MKLCLWRCITSISRTMEVSHPKLQMDHWGQASESRPPPHSLPHAASMWRSSSTARRWSWVGAETGCPAETQHGVSLAPSGGCSVFGELWSCCGCSTWSRGWYAFPRPTYYQWQASAASESPPFLLDLMDEDWGAVVINMDKIGETLGLALTTTPSPNQPSRPDLEILPNGIPVEELDEFLGDKGDHLLTYQAEMVRQKFSCSAEDLPRLQLAVEINRAARTWRLICSMCWRRPYNVTQLVLWLFRRLRRNFAWLRQPAAKYCCQLPI